MESILDSLIITSRVIRDKCWYGLWHFDLHKQVKRIYPKEPYYKDLYDVLTSQPDHIVDNIFLGNAFNAADYKWLKDNNIKEIVNVTPSISNYFPDDFVYHNVDVIDLNDASLKGFYQQFYDIIENAKCNIFVHCFAGKSRSAALVLYYLVKKYKWTVEEAINIIKVKRPAININITFINEIQEILTPDIEYF